jgi:hypothetical protein
MQQCGAAATICQAQPSHVAETVVGAVFYTFLTVLNVVATLWADELHTSPAKSPNCLVGMS